MTAAAELRAAMDGEGDRTMAEAAAAEGGTPNREWRGPLGQPNGGDGILRPPPWRDKQNSLFSQNQWSESPSWARYKRYIGPSQARVSSILVGGFRTIMLITRWIRPRRDNGKDRQDSNWYNRRKRQQKCYSTQHEWHGSATLVKKQCSLLKYTSARSLRCPGGHLSRLSRCYSSHSTYEENVGEQGVIIDCSLDHF